MKISRGILTGIRIILMATFFLSQLTLTVKGVVVDEREEVEENHECLSDEDHTVTPYELTGDEGSEKPKYAPGEIIVKFRAKSEIANNLKLALQIQDDLSLKSQEIINLGAPQGLIKGNTILEPVFKGLHQRMKATGSDEETLNQITLQRLSKKRKMPVNGAKNNNLSNVYILKNIDIQNESIEEIIQRLSQDPDIEYAEPNYIMELQRVPNDPYYHSSGSWEQDYDDLWGLKRIRVEEAWDNSQGKGVVVAVIDTGVDYNHEDIAANIWENVDEIPNNGIDDDGNGYIDDVVGYDFSDIDNDPSDYSGHGTHCAGTIAAVGDNAIGIIGVAPCAKIMPIKIFPNAYLNVCAEAIRYAADNGAEVLNNSWGGPFSDVIKDAVDYAHSSGCVIVVAAGNEWEDINVWKWWSGMSACPANLKNTIAVAATDLDNQRARFSNWGVGIDIAAPGVDILSLRAEGTDIYGDEQYIVDEKYYRASGTSMACPHIAGAAALILSKYPEFTNEDVRQVLVATAEPLTDSDSCQCRWDGYGYVDMYQALEIDSPLEVDITNPAQQPAPIDHIRGIVDITGIACGDNFQYYKIEYSYHNIRYPDFNWQSLISSGTPVSNGLLFSWDTSSVADGEYVLKLTAVDMDDNNFERKFLINIGNDYQMGWPVRTEGITDSSPVFADIDQDGDQEIIVISADHKVYCWHHNGELVEGWPMYVPNLTGNGVCYISSPAVGDLDPDYVGLEIVVAGWLADGFGNSYVHAWHCDGTPVDNWPVKRMCTPQGVGAFNPVNSSPALADIDGDSYLEVVVGGWSTAVWAFNHDGSRVNGWPVTVVLGTGLLMATPAIGDLDRSYDGLEVVIGTVEVEEGCKNKMYALHSDGTYVEGWPIELEPMGSSKATVRSSAALGDLDNDGKLEVIVGAMNGKLYTWRHDGTSMEGFPLQLGEEKSSGYYVGIESSPGLSDLDQDGYLEIVVCTADTGGGNKIYAINHDGTFVDKYWPNTSSGLGYSSPAIGDINNDDYNEVVIGAGDTSMNKTIMAFGHLGSRYTSLLTKRAGSRRWSSPAIGDIDGDGDVEVIIGSIADPLVRIWDLPYEYNPANMPWPMFHRDPQHTGCYPIQNQPPSIKPISDQEVDEGESISISIIIDDPDEEDILSIFGENLPSFVEIVDHGNRTGELIIIPGFDDAGTYTGVTVVAEDSYGEQAKAVFTVNIINVNRAPVFDCIKNEEVNEGETLRIRLTANDPDGDSLTFSKNEGSVGTLTEEGLFTYTPGYDDAGDKLVTFAVSDGELSISETITITVINANRPPQILSLRILWRRYFVWLGRDAENGFRIKYSYRIDEGNWSRPSRRMWIRISKVSRRLKRGKHLFSVKAIDKNGAESEPISVEFRK